MPLLSKIESVENSSKIKDSMESLIRDYFDNSTLKDSDSSIKRIEIEIPELNLISWLAAQTDERKTYWADRDKKIVIAGVSHAIEFNPENSNNLEDAITKMSGLLEDSSNHLKFFGGIEFSDYPHTNIDNKKWDSFGSYKFIIPRFEIIQSDQKFIFACNLLESEKGEKVESVICQLQQLSFESTKQVFDLPKLIDRSDLPSRLDWDKKVELSLEKIKENGLKKVVIARKSKLRFDKQISPVSVMSALDKKTFGCFNFLFQIDAQNSFLGATPELLYSRNSREIETEAIAGTRKRSQNKEKDLTLERELLNSEKDIREQQYVVDSISDSLNRLCSSFENINQNRLILKLAKVQHLISKFKGVLKKDITDSAILKSMHPTPAVGGFPTNKAISEIKEIEPFPRGWYAGPVGWISKDSSKFVVAIRSALINQNEIFLYSGAGIVDGSCAEEEWNEIENKISNFVSILN